ncbi:putative FYVE, RhoGEF and PH domain-containing protein 2 [Trypanosoma grayi]|uniref:putative FYVE, RhoGEF and PH domain-containing protein 2 n=1 Tax=Trypanosoma grayi TaxID=71804 RepID=UPI0004F48955|nr:putative FYVE, RhoGEF and PH domain-containing protein 2 [Trypanosoma grayi]KEG07866.1 putative FYVE, RhoGEF and PH domain-containing protein 2 [Trypanosoma grayi]
MSFNLDDLFDTRPRQQQMANPAYVPPPPPSDPPPPPVIHQDPFGANAALPPPPPFDAAMETPQPYHPNAYTSAQTHSSTVMHSAPPPQGASYYVAPAPTAGIQAPYNNAPPTSVLSQAPYHALPQPATISQAPCTVPPAEGGYNPVYQTALGPPATPPDAPNRSSLPLGVNQAVSAPEAAAVSVANNNIMNKNPALAQEEEDRKQLEKIIQLRKELERERERERQKREELETWGCPSCTYRNALDTNQCGMCDTKRPGYNPPPSVGASSTTHSTPVPAPVQLPKKVTQPSQPAGPTAWICSMCLAPNEAHHSRCKVCKSYQKNGTPVISSSGQGTGAATSPAMPPTAWLCSICGKKNGARDARCETCNSYQNNGTPIMESDVLPQSVSEAAPTSWKCSVCTLENPISNAVCEACQSGQRPRHLAPPKAKNHDKKKWENTHFHSSSPKTWTCPTCTYHNAIVLEKCEMCSTGRPPHLKPPPPPPSTSASKKETFDSGDEIQWQDDTVAKECNRCHLPFNLTRRRHHCRACGFVFCGSCSAFQVSLKKNGQPERVCVSCYEAHK